MQALLEVKNLTKSFGGLTVLKDLSFEVREGEILGLIGPNGSGKTTVFNIITGFIHSDSGVITFKGNKITGLQPNKICRKGIARTFQIPKPFRKLSVLENVLVGAYCSTSNLEKAKEEAEASIEFVGLSKREHDMAKDLGSFEVKLLEISRALATKPELLLLDEFVAGLNPKEVEETLDSIRGLLKKGKVHGLIIVEHVMKAIMGLSDRIVVIHHGEKIGEGTPEEVSSDDAVIKAYLGTRYKFAKAE